MPSLSPTMERGNIVAWKIKEGDAIKPGDILADIETDKATLGFENQDEGFIARLLLPDGSRDIDVGTPVAILVDDAASVAAFASYAAESPLSASASSTLAPAAPAAAPAPKTVQVSSRIGPAARYFLEGSGLSVSDIHPTGPNGIVTKSDVLQAISARAVSSSAASSPAPVTPTPAPAAQAPPPPPAASGATHTSSKPAAAAKQAPAPPASAIFHDTPTTQVRRIIASRLLDSKRSVPAIYASADADLGPVADFRKMLAAQGTKVSVNDVVLKAIALTLKQVPQANVFWSDKESEVKAFHSVDISVAVATERGLLTPIVKNAETKTLKEISKEVKELALRARENKLKPDEFQGGSFTVSNLGMYGLSHFSAIINPPQACILAVGGAQTRVVLREGKLVEQTYMTVTLSADNRVYDGDLLGQVLTTFTSVMSNPMSLLL